MVPAVSTTETNGCIPSLCPPSLPVPASMAGAHTSVLFKTHAGHHLPTKDSTVGNAGTKLYNLIPGVSDSVSSLTSFQLPELKRLDSPGGKSILGSGPLGRRVKLIMMAPQANGVGRMGQDFSSLIYKYFHSILFLSLGQ